jgi:glycosyltransferase involved in cell wall biosynthesis
VKRRDPQRPIRVAQVCATVDGGLWMVQIAVGLQRRGFDVVAIIGGEGGGTAAALRKAGIPYVVRDQRMWRHSRLGGLVGRIPGLRPLRRLVDGLLFADTVLRMAWTLRRLQVDIAHTHIFSSMLVTRLASTIARVPVSVAMIAGPLHLESPKIRRLDFATMRFEDRLLAGCRYTYDLYLELGAEPEMVRTVGYGIDPAGFDPAAADGARVRRELGVDVDTVLVGQVAWFYPALVDPIAPPSMTGRGIKGHEDLLAAARIVLDCRPNVRFVVVGDGFGAAGVRHYEDVLRLAEELELGDGVIFAGRRPDLVDVLAALDVSVQASLSENYGGTIESLLMERPMVATAVGGMPEVVRDGETGLLVPPRDPEALAGAIIRLVDDREAALQMGKAGRQLMLERHTIQHTIEGVVDAYSELAKERNIRRPPFDGRPLERDPSDIGSLGLMPEDVLFPGADPGAG